MKLEPIAAIDSAVAALADRACSTAEALSQNGGQVSPVVLLVRAVKAVVLKNWGSYGAIDEARAAYARRICTEQGVEPNMLVVCDPVPVAQLVGETPAIAFTDHLPNIEPAWVRVYRRLPSMENIEGDKLSHARGSFRGDCTICGATREEFDDRVISPYACLGPCTEVRMLWKFTNSTGEQQCWQAPAKDGMPTERYMRRIGASASVSEAVDFERWKRENTP